MEHRTIAPLLTDLMWGRLDPTRSSAAWLHVAQCADCQETLAAAHLVRAAVSAGGPPLFEDHPSADELSAFAFADPDIELATLARIGDHVRDCASCRSDVRLAQAAGNASPDGIGIVLAWARRLWSGESKALAPALASLALLLAYPAYRGIVDLPDLRRENQRAARELSALRVEGDSLRRSQIPTGAEPNSWSGGFRLLYLNQPTRGKSSLPTVPSSPGDAYQPIVLDCDLSALTANQPTARVEVILRGVPSGKIEWRHAGRAAELWDPGYETINVFVPSRVLEPGVHRLELLVDGVADHCAASFRVVAGSAR